MGILELIGKPHCMMTDQLLITNEESVEDRAGGNRLTAAHQRESATPPIGAKGSFLTDLHLRLCNEGSDFHACEKLEAHPSAG